MRAIAEEAGELVRKYKGAFSGEHGDGLCRGEWIEWQFGPAHQRRPFAPSRTSWTRSTCSTRARSSIRRRWTTAPCSASRRATAPRPYRRIALTPVLDWSAWNVQADPVTEIATAPGTGGDVTGGFAKAVEMCNNNGHCRKFDAGTMCPSYRVTRDEQHLTRGRANTLRLAVSGQLGPDAFTGDAMRDAMDLCVGCKGCRRECPTGVDMARMKIEFLAHYKARHGHTLRGPAGGAPARLCAPRQPPAVAAEPAQHRARCRLAGRETARPVGATHAAALARRHLLARAGRVDVRQRRGHGGGRPRRPAGGRAVRRYLQRHLRERERAGRSPRAEGGGLHAAIQSKRPAATIAAAEPTWPAAWWPRPGPGLAP